MREIVASITQRGQVTIPAEVRRLLGVKPRDKVAFKIEDGQVRLEPAAYTLESVYRSVPPLRGKRLSDEEMVRRAKDEHAAKVIRKMREE